MPWKKYTGLCAVSVAESDYEKRIFRINRLLPETWSHHYLKKNKVVLLQTKTGKPLPAGMTLQLEQNLRNLFGTRLKRISWGYQKTGNNACCIFPTGELAVLFRPGISAATARTVLSSLGLEKIHQQVQPRKPPRRLAAVAVAPAYARGKERALRQLQAKPAPLSPVFSPQVIFSVSTTPDQSLSLLAKLRRHVAVQLASINSLVLHKGAPFELHNMTTPPESGSGDMLFRNQVSKAWRLFYPQSGPGPAGHFLCSTEKVAVLDYNFMDNPYFDYACLGFDAYDYDHDPRTPIRPDGATVAQIIYCHGTFMSGIIAGTKQGRKGECGVAPGSAIVPFRPLDVEDVEIMEDTAQYCLSYAWDWWYTLQRLYFISCQGHIKIANYSGTVNELIWGSEELDPWLEYFIKAGDNGRGILLCVSAGNNPDKAQAACLARNPHTFGVAWADYANERSLGNYGTGVDICVDEGNVPFYSPEGDDYVNLQMQSGSSGSCAVVSGVAALMRQAAGWSMTAGEIMDILRQTTRYSKSHAGQSDAQGRHPRFGYGFLDAFHAVKVAYKSRAKPVQARVINFMADHKPALLMQTTLGSGNYAGKPGGNFWCFQEVDDENGQRYWRHLRLTQTRHCEIVLDSISPMGTLLGIGDFDGDGCDEIALQMNYWVTSPEHYFMVRKYNETQQRWNSLGAGIAAGSGIQWAFPKENPMSELITARLRSLRKSYLLARQGTMLFGAQYLNNRWQAFGPQGFRIPASSPTLRQSMTITQEWIHCVKPFPRPGKNDALAVLGSIVESKGAKRPGERPRSIRHITLSLLEYDERVAGYINVPLDGPETHLLVLRNAIGLVVDDVLTGHFTASPGREIVLGVKQAGRLKKIILVTPQTGQSYRLYTMPVPQASQRVCGSLQSGDVDGCGKAEIVQLVEKSTGEKYVQAWRCYAASGGWHLRGNPLTNRRKDSQVLNFHVCEYENGEQAQVGLLMEKPHANTYRVYKMVNKNNSLIFEETGLW